jgi:hypothetical protein
MLKKVYIREDSHKVSEDACGDMNIIQERNISKKHFLEDLLKQHECHFFFLGMDKKEAQDYFGNDKTNAIVFSQFGCVCAYDVHEIFEWMRTNPHSLQNTNFNMSSEQVEMVISKMNQLNAVESNYLQRRWSKEKLSYHQLRLLHLWKAIKKQQSEKYYGVWRQNFKKMIKQVLEESERTRALRQALHEEQNDFMVHYEEWKANVMQEHEKAINEARSQSHNNSIDIMDCLL